MRKGLWAIFFAMFLETGCATCRVASDQDGLRKAVLDLNTNQIMDNLIRLDKGLPIIHIDYSQLTGQVTDSASVEGDLEQTVHHALSLPLMITRELTNVWTGKLGASRQNQVSVTGQPVTTIPEVYNAYLAFYAKNGRLMKSPDPPPPGEAIIVRCAKASCEDHGCSERNRRLWWCRSSAEVMYYWIPCAFKEDFRELCLYAVALRGQIQAAPDFFSVTILGVQNDKLIKDRKDEQVVMTIVLDQEVPNAQGSLIATIKGRLYERGELLIQPFPGKRTAQPLGPGRPEEIVTSDRLQLTFVLGEQPGAVNATKEEAINDLVKQSVKLKMKQFSPAVPKTSDLLQQIRNQLELIRLGQQLRRDP